MKYKENDSDSTCGHSMVNLRCKGLNRITLKKRSCQTVCHGNSDRVACNVNPVGKGGDHPSLRSYNAT